MVGRSSRCVQRAGSRDRRRGGRVRLAVTVPRTGAYRSTVENSVYVAADHRGRGVADRLLGNLLEVARTSGFHSVIARIGGNNEASTALHAKHGFREVGVERQVGRKFGRWQDVTVMQVVFDDA